SAHRESHARNDDESGMEEWKEGRGRAGGTPGFSQGGPLCLIGVHVNAEPMRLEKSKTPLASPAQYAAHAPASARLLAQAGRPREPYTAHAAAARARRWARGTRERMTSTGILENLTRSQG